MNGLKKVTPFKQMAIFGTNSSDFWGVLIHFSKTKRTSSRNKAVFDPTSGGVCLFIIFNLGSSFGLFGSHTTFFWPEKIRARMDRRGWKGFSYVWSLGFCGCQKFKMKKIEVNNYFIYSWWLNLSNRSRGYSRYPYELWHRPQTFEPFFVWLEYQK